MPSITYWDSVVESGNRRQELGTTNYDNEFVPMYADASGHLNADFVETLNDERMTSFNVRLESGSATLRKENFRIVDGKSTFYWYAYKKLKGKLNKTYVGLTDNLTEEILEAAIEIVNKPKEVTQDVCVTKKTKPIAPVAPVDAIANLPTALAGHGKNANHLQPDLIDCFESLAIAQNEITILNKMLKEAQDDVVEASRKEHEQWQKIKPLQVQVEKRNALIDSLEARNKELSDLVAINSKLTNQLEQKNATLQKALDERDSELFSTHQKLLSRNDELENSHKLMAIRNGELNECISERDEVLEINNHLQMQVESLQDELTKVSGFEAIIAKYRAMTVDKTKKANPRYAYLMDFLAEIDKLS